MKNILITGIGGDLGQSISNVIKDSFVNFQLYGTDINSLNSGNLFCKEMYLLPKANDNSYINKLNELTNRLNIDLIIPSSQQEQSSISKFLINSQLNNVPVLGCFQEISSFSIDKLKTIKWLSSKGIKVPETFLFSDLKKKDIKSYITKNKKFILKKRTGSGSTNILTINEISQIPKNVYEKASEWILQEWIPSNDGEYTIAVTIINSKSNHIQLKRVLRFGSTSYAEIVEIKNITDLVNKVIMNLTEDAAFNIQLRIKEGVPMIFEINPRFSSTVYARHILGFPDLAEWISYSLQLKNKFVYNYKTGMKFYRYFAYKVKE